MDSTFISCYNLSGNIIIHSEFINNAYLMFYGTELEKNVYIPFQNNGVNTSTFNAFIAAGYSTTTRVNGALLFDINSL